MKRVFVTFCALVLMVVVGCQNDSGSGFEATLEFYYQSQTTLSDTVSIAEGVSDVQGKIDSIVTDEMISKKLVGKAFFGAVGSDVYAVDSLINLQAESLYYEMKATLAGYNFDSLLESKVDYYQGDVMVEYSLYNVAINYLNVNDTISTFYLGDDAF